MICARPCVSYEHKKVENMFEAECFHRTQLLEIDDDSVCLLLFTENRLLLYPTTSQLVSNTFIDWHFQLKHLVLSCIASLRRNAAIQQIKTKLIDVKVMLEYNT